MAFCRRFLSEEQFLCSICLDVFSEPVSTPCGHNFCQNCIKHYWETTRICQCPLCKTKFQKIPNLKVNTFISELANQFTMSLQVEDSSDPNSGQAWAKSLAVVCEICDDPKLEAIKSCLECLTSYCEVHLEPHHRAAGLKRHTLVDPDKNLGENVCRHHNRLLTLFCQVDEVALCDVCAGMRHKSHMMVPVLHEYRAKQAQLGRTEASVQQMIQDRLQKVQEIKLSMKTSQEEAEKQIASTIQDFSSLVSAIKSVQAEHIGVIEERQRAADEQAEDFIRVLEQEITELQRTNAQVRDLMHTENHLLFLQNFPSQSILPETKDWSTVDINGCLGIETLKKSLNKSMSHLHLTLDQMSMEIKNDWEDRQVLYDPLQLVQQYEVEFSLDPETANPFLILSDDGKHVWFSNDVQRLAQNPKMFTLHYAVLGNMGFCSGQFYYEVYVGGKTEWVLGVAGESLPHRSQKDLRAHHNLWAIQFIIDECESLFSPHVPVYQGKMEKVGVFVDYEAGLVSFYNVDARSLIYSFTGCNFNEKLYPYFNPCDNEYGSNQGPLVIVPVGHSVSMEAQ